MQKKIVILGAGICGLSTAWYLQKKYGKSVDITIVEKSDRVGGWIQTSNVDGYLFDHGPHSCRTYGAGIHTLELIEDLEIQDQVIVADSSATSRFLYYDKKLQKIPSGLFTALFSKQMGGILKALWKDLRIEKCQHEDESVYDFFRRRLDSTLIERFIDPFISGIYAGNMRQLSLKACFPSLFQLEHDYGSIIKGLFLKKRGANQKISPFVKSMSQSHLFSFKEGMEQLPKAIIKKINANLIFNAKVSNFEYVPDGIVVTLSDEKIIEADYVISTIPYFELKKIIKTDADFDIPYTSVAVVHLGFDKKVLNKKGFGYLIPHQEKEDILGCIWDSSVFPQQNNHPDMTRLTVMMGGSCSNKSFEIAQNDYIENALQAIERHLKISALPQVTAIHLAKCAIPQYEIGYLSNKERFLTCLNPRLKVMGQSFNGISVNESILGARNLILY